MNVPDFDEDAFREAAVTIGADPRTFVTHYCVMVDDPREPHGQQLTVALCTRDPHPLVPERLTYAWELVSCQVCREKEEGRLADSFTVSGMWERGPKSMVRWIDEHLTITDEQARILADSVNRHSGGRPNVWETTNADPRPSRDEFWLGVAKAYAAGADCSRRKVGAVIVDTDASARGYELGGGYNGYPPGEPGCLTADACPRAHSDVEPGSSYDTGEGRCGAVHAEVNAILTAGGRDACQGATLYVTAEPCAGCVPIIKAAGIARVVFDDGDAIWNETASDL